MLITVFLAVVLTAKAARYAAWSSVGEGGVAAVEAVEVRGSRHFVFVRGTDRNAPLLVFLPGGPGESVVPLAHEFTRTLEDHFVVVHLELGVGKADPFPDGLTLDAFVADTEVVITSLRRRFDDRPAILVGHSLGAVQAFKLAARDPGAYAGVVTVGQPVHWPEGNRLAHAEAQRRAERAGDVEALEAIAVLPPTLLSEGDEAMIDFAAVARQREILRRYAMENVLEEHTADARWWTYLTSPHHSLGEACNLLWRADSPCAFFGRDPQWWAQWSGVIPGVVRFDARRSVRSLEAPFLAIAGDNDWICPSALIAAFAASIDAPETGFVSLPGAGHYAHLDDPDGFQAAILAAFAPDAGSGGHGDGRVFPSAPGG